MLFCEGEGKTAGRVTFAMVISQIACLVTSLSMGFIFGMLGRMISATHNYRSTILFDTKRSPSYYIGARYS